MLKQKSKLSTKLLLFIFTISFFLIAGSFAYFYFSGRTFLLNSTIKELTSYSQLFDRSVKNQIENYSNILSPLVFNFSSSKIDEDKLNISVKNILLNNFDKIDEIVLKYNSSKKTIVFLPITVLGGEKVINTNTIRLDQFNNLVKSIKITTKINTTDFGYVKNKAITNYYLKRKFNYFSIIIKIKNLTFYETIINNIYFSENTNFSICNTQDMINYSTNKFWINQQLNKYFNAANYTDNFFLDNKNYLIYGQWKNKFLNSKVYISNNFIESYNSFISLLNKLLLYSISIFLLIVSFSILYIRKISKSLNEITRITAQIGEGNFNDKINIKRNDELGLLVETFNNMIVELKASYSKLNLTNIELKNKLDELSKTRIELSKKQKLAFIGETISKITHEIQNKISGVSVWVQNLEFQIAEDENLSLYINEIKQSLNSFMEMLQNFKKFYRKPYLEIKNVNVVEIIEKVCGRFSSDLIEKKIYLEKIIHNPKIIIDADKKLIEEVIENLIVNAIYFSPEHSTLQITIEQKKSDAIFTICDEGPGINTEDIENIFNPFFTTKSSGSGLGLSIVKNIIDAHKGRIEVTKRKTKGICFCISLPKKQNR